MLLSQKKPCQGSLCSASCVKHQLLWAGMLPAEQGFGLYKHVMLEEYFKEGKVQIILQKCFIFPNFSQMQKCADIFQNLLSAECHFTSHTNSSPALSDYTSWDI